MSACETKGNPFHGKGHMCFSSPNLLPMQVSWLEEPKWHGVLGIAANICLAVTAGSIVYTVASLESAGAQSVAPEVGVTQVRHVTGARV